jgi:hypothetical protein
MLSTAQRRAIMLVASWVVLSSVAVLLSPGGALAQGQRSTLKSWNACPTIEHTNQMLVFDGSSAICERMKTGSLVIVERTERAPARRWMCIDHPSPIGPYASCNWHTFQDEQKTWLCVRYPNSAEPCKWGPAEYFTTELAEEQSRDRQ